MRLLRTLGLACVVVASPAVWAQTGPWDPTEEEQDLARTVVDELNAARSAAGLEPLSSHPNLDLLAYQHAYDMAERGTVSHHSHRFGMGTRTRVELAFPQVFQFGENVAANRSPAALHTALMNSTGHRLNRMDPTFTHVGMGVARAGEHQLYLAEIFVKVFDETPLATIATLYSAGDLAAGDEDPLRGEIVDEVVRVGAPTEDNPEYWTSRGIDAFARQDYAAAVDYFERSIEIDPGYEYAYFNLGRAYIGNDQPEDGLRILDHVLDGAPNDLDAQNSRGTALLLLQRYAEAEEAFRRVIETRTRDAGAWYNLGLALETQGKREEAERAYRQALHLAPDLTAAAAALARVSR